MLNKIFFSIWMLVAPCMGAQAINSVTTNHSVISHSVKTETVYLSGYDADQTVKWDFLCSKGMNSGKWRKIAVPSCWEQQGFGEYTYGRYYKKKGGKVSDEMGTYRYRFMVPKKWMNKTIHLHFDGVMTDTRVLVNGKEVGAVHQGGFTSFSYDITPYVNVGKNNLLEVFVKKQSDDYSVNMAERHADWWLFGGIYRPVYMQALPKQHIERVAVDAKVDGSMQFDLYTQGLTTNATSSSLLTPNNTYRLKVSLQEVGGQTEYAVQTVSLLSKNLQRIALKWQHVRAWDIEHPHLYEMKMQLLSAQGDVLHEYQQRIGFRTMEFRRRDGFYLNGKKLMIKGINRHCFYPETGRTTSKRLDINDVKLVKGMNANAIRSHYPPDKHFLDICDSLGVLYFDELPGWQNHYSTEVGMRILKEMMVDDANHPCIFAWGNGNEGGFNYELDSLFRKLDIQQRHVVHPWALFDGVDAHHYPAYQTGVHRLHHGYEVFMPTEFLHSQYDKGGGASLDEYWSHWKNNPLFAGGFIWAMIDEGVMRTDQNGKIDTDGTNAPDGVVGPHREKEGSWFTIRDVWSPIQISPFRIRTSWDGRFLVRNDFLFSKLTECKMNYRIISCNAPKSDLAQGDNQILSEGTVLLPNVDSGESGYAQLSKSEDFSKGDILELTALDRLGDTIHVWSYPMKYADEYFSQQHLLKNSNAKAMFEQHSELDLKMATLQASCGVKAVFDLKTGMLVHIYNKEKEIPFNQGPLPIGMKMKLQKVVARQDGNDALLVMSYTGAVDSIVWRMTSDGMLGMDAVILNHRNGKKFEGEFFDQAVRNLGFSFSYPEKICTGMRWMGKGPYRVWRNRLRGPQFGVWQKAYNNTVTGESWDYPEFKGYHANLYWVQMQSFTAPFTVYTETDGLFYRVFTPEEPKALNGEKTTMQVFPEGDISFLFEIPGIQSYKPIEQLGPEAQPGNIRINIGDDGLRMKLWFDFR